MAKKKTKQILQILLIVTSIGSLYFVPWLLVKAWILPLPDTLQGQLNEALEHGFDGAIVYVHQKDKLPQKFAAGWHNKEERIPAKPDALFKIASISKLYDAVSVTKLVCSGRLALDKTLEEYIPDLRDQIENSDKITLKHMIQHRSGIPNFTDAPNFWAEPTKSFDESLALIQNKPSNFIPGEDYEYCNTNYLLINRIMDDELGYPNFQFIQQEILNPLELKNTYSSLKDVNMDDVMSGYHVGHPYDLKADEHGMLSTAEDVGLFLRALNTGSLFEGNEEDIYASIYEYEHGGWVPGYQSFANYDRDLDAVIVAFYSTTDPKLYNWNLSEIINDRIVKILEK